MHSILIAHRDSRFAEQLASELRADGYYTSVTCPGPWPPQRCIRCDKGYCPLTEAADLMLYDPELTEIDDDGRLHILAVESARAHPDVPMLLVWSPNAIPDATTLRAIQTEAPRAQVGAQTAGGLRRQIHDLLVPQLLHWEVLS
jgi:hypothetical protein